MRFPKITKRRIVFVVLILAVIGGVYYWRSSKKKNGFEKETVKRGEVVESLVLSGEIEATEHAELTYETSGQVTYVGVVEGEIVKKGQVLGKLDTTTLNSSYQQALANLRKYDATVESVHDQVKNHSGDETYAQKDTRTTAEVNKDSAYEAVIVAERNLKGATIKAPFTGIVTYVANSFSGGFAIYTQKQFEIFNPETIYFKVSADQTEVTDLKKEQSVSVVLDSFSEKEIKGNVSEISFVPDSAGVGVVYGVKVVLEGTEIEYRLGMTGDATFVMGKAEDVLYVPTKFVKSDKEGKYVLTSGGKKKVYVELGVEGEDRTEIKGEIKEGEMVYD